MPGSNVRADALRNREAVLAAADDLFASRQSPQSVSMDDVAAAAGVGKGTLFRRFGDRAGLINAVYSARTEPLRQAIATGLPPLGPDTPPRERIIAILDAMLQIKLDNRHLSLALEQAGDSCQGPGYDWVCSVIADAIRQLPWLTTEPTWTAHALLAATRADLIERLLSQERMPPEQIKADLTTFAAKLLAPDKPGNTSAAQSAPRTPPSGP